MKVRITNKDIIWTYIAQILGLGAGFLTLPLILNKLSAEEVGFNYLMMTVGTIANLFDMGFVVQFGRNLTYVLSGANELQENGISSIRNTEINYKLVNTIIDTSRYVYKRLSLIILLGLFSIGTLYIYNATNRFTLVNNSLLIWLTYCVSIYFNVYFKYIDSLLNGAAMIAESRKALVFTKLVYIVIAYILLLLDFGLISVVIANLISPFVGRYYSIKCFYTKEVKLLLNKYHSTKEEIRLTFYSIWSTTKKIAFNMIGSFASNQAGMFISGLFLSLQELGSYGLMLQLFNILSGLSLNVIIAYQPQFCKDRVQNNYNDVIKNLSFGVVVSFLIKVIGILSILFLAPYFLSLIKSQSLLPSVVILLVYGIQSLLHDNMVAFCTYITTGNIVPFLRPSLVTACFIILITFLLLYKGFGILGAILAILIPELIYNVWKWPLYVMKELRLKIIDFYCLGFKELVYRLRLILGFRIY